LKNDAPQKTIWNGKKCLRCVVKSNNVFVFV